MTVLTAYFLVRGKSRFMFLLSALVDIPYALPGVVISVSFVLLFAAPIPLLGVTLYGTIWIILLAYFSSFFAVSLKPMVSAFLQFDPSLEEAARLSGAGFWRRLKDIILPLVGPAAGASVILVFLIACNELTVSARSCGRPAPRPSASSSTISMTAAVSISPPHFRCLSSSWSLSSCCCSKFWGAICRKVVPWRN